MSPEEKLEMGRKMIAEAEAEIAAKKRNWPEKIEAGMLFRHDGGAIYIFPARDCDDLLCVVGDKSDSPGDYYSRDLLCSETQSITYLGHARDLIKIADDAHEPTGVELVGKMCQFSECDFDEFVTADSECHAFGTKGYMNALGVWWKYARLAR